MAKKPKPSPNAPVGEGGRFAALMQSIAKRGKVRDPGAVAASIGRAKYGSKRFQEMAIAGRRSTRGSPPFTGDELAQGYRRAGVTWRGGS